jgi:hypothetical protein
MIPIITFVLLVVVESLKRLFENSALGKLCFENSALKNGSLKINPL